MTKRIKTPTSWRLLTCCSAKPVYGRYGSPNLLQPDHLAQRCDGLDRSDTSFVLGGLAPVPLLFFIGVIMDDESNAVVMGRDQQVRGWRGLTIGDDGSCFAAAGLNTSQLATTPLAKASSILTLPMLGYERHSRCLLPTNTS
jgi:hypothetical protein